jgi:hypothetical protein
MTNSCWWCADGWQQWQQQGPAAGLATFLRLLPELVLKEQNLSTS